VNAHPHIDTLSAWLVAYTQPRAETRAKMGIEEIGHEVFVPMEKLRQKAENRRLWRQVDRPLFSRYVFVRPRFGYWGDVLAVDGVTDILRNNDVASTVPAAWIDAMRKAESYGVFDRTQGSPNPFEIGELVRVSAGPYTGHNVIVAELIAKLKSTTAKKRAKVLLDFMGRKVKIDIDVCELEKL
jgi:transcription antitermination factor NusG